MALFPSQEWVTAFRDAINASTAYREAAETWEGAIAFSFEAEPDRGVPDDVWALLDLWHGACREAAIVTPAAGARAPYVIRAPYSRWRSILEGDLDPIKAMMQGKLKVRGNLATIVRYVRAANELVRLTGTVPTEFIGDTV
ncbi:MAG: SCP2 sterol-binding domain-containing protein [Actinomycetota bacterium]